jgi:hypothetical protein
VKHEDIGGKMKRIEVDTPSILEGTIIDFETTHWVVEKGELITAGFLSKEGILILQRLELTENEFKKKVIEEIQTKRRPWYAFNKEFEEKFLPITMDKELQQNERESAFGALLDEGLLDHYDLLCDPLFNEEIHRFWNAWKSTKDMVFVSKIVRHNYCCLAKEYYLKLKRIDKLDMNQIKPLPSSAQIEKRYVRKQLDFFVE